MGLEVLASTNVDQVSPVLSKVISVSASETVTKVLHSLAENNIFCVPVEDKGKIIGLIDMVDIVSYVVEVAGKTEGSGESAAYLRKVEEAHLKSERNDHVAGLSKKNRYCPVTAGTSVLDAMKVMTDNHVQRLPVVSVDFQLRNFVTQSAIIQFLQKHIDELGDFVDKSLAQLGFRPKDIISISVNRPTIDAFRLISEKKITGIPVMDTDGTMITNISCSDLRDVATDPKLFEYLHMPLDSFIPIMKSKINPKKESSMNVMYPKISCKFETTFRTVVGKLAATKIHRIYITDDHDAPIGIVSLIDIIEKVVNMTRH